MKKYYFYIFFLRFSSKLWSSKTKFKNFIIVKNCFRILSQNKSNPHGTFFAYSGRENYFESIYAKKLQTLGVCFRDKWQKPLKSP